MNRILAHTSIIGTFSVATSSNTLFLIRNDGNVGIGANPIDYTKVFIDHTYSIEPPPSQFIVGTFLKTTATFSEKVHPLRVGIGDLLEPYDIETNAPTVTSTIFSYFNATSSVGDNDTSLYGGVLYRTGDSKAFGLDVKIRGANKDSIGGRVNVGDAYGLNIGFQSTISGTSGGHYGMRNSVGADTEISNSKYGVYNTVGGDAYKNYGTYNQITFKGNVSERYGTYNSVEGENGEGTASYNFGVYNRLTSNYESENVGVYTYIGKPGDSGYLNVGHYIFVGSDDSTNIGLYINVESTAGTSQSAIIVNKGSSTFNDDQQPLSDFTIRSSGKSHMFHVDSTNDCIGIGTQSPAYDLEVAGGFKAKQIYIANGIDQILSESGDAVLGFGAGYEFNFTTDGGTGAKGRIQVSDTESIFGNTYGLIESNTTAGYLTHDQKWTLSIGANYRLEIDSKVTIKDVLRVNPIGTTPSTPVSGDIFFYTGDNTLKCYDGSTWRNLY